MILGAHTITVRRATTSEDAYGNDERTWGDRLIGDGERLQCAAGRRR
jgi:hypothetical protein